VYKDHNGVRPRFHGKWNVQQLDEAIRHLDANPLPEQEIRPSVPLSGDGWTFVTTDDVDVVDVGRRLEADYYDYYQ